MRALLLNDLALALMHLLDEKMEVLDYTSCGRAFRPRLVARLAAIEALPPIRAASRPHAETLVEAELVRETIALLEDLRAAIVDELGADPSVALRVDGELFGYIDLLATTREAFTRRRAMVINVVLPGLADLAPLVE